MRTLMAPEPADGGDIQMEYSSDQLYTPSIIAAKKNYLYELGYHLINQNIQ
jgi:hypothetical protein